MNLRLGLALLLVVATYVKTASGPPQHRDLLRRNLQPNPPDPPPLPGPPTETTNSDTEPIGYCDFMFLFFEVQASEQGYDCTCVSAEEVVVVTCENESLQCDPYRVGNVDWICHKHHYTVTSSKTDFHREGFKTYAISSCFEYTERAPIFMQLRNLCYVYALNWTYGEYIDLETCEVTFEKDIGQPQQICQCSMCEVGNFLGIPIWGLGMDCQEAFGIKMVDCIPLTEADGIVVAPEIEEIHPPSDNDIPVVATPGADPATSEPSTLGSEMYTFPTVPPTHAATELGSETSPLPSNPPGGDGLVCDWKLSLKDIDGDVHELECSCDTVVDAFEVVCTSKLPECDGLQAPGEDETCYDVRFSATISPDWQSGNTTFFYVVCKDYSYPNSAPANLRGREFCFEYAAIWNWASFSLETCNATFSDSAGQVEVCPCSICETTNNSTGYALACLTTNVTFLDCQPLLSPIEVSLPYMLPNAGTDGPSATGAYDI